MVPLFSFCRLCGSGTPLPTVAHFASESVGWSSEQVLYHVSVSRLITQWHGGFVVRGMVDR